jgi:hypothetical protein
VKNILFNQAQNLLRMAGQPPLGCYCRECQAGMLFRCDTCDRLMPWCMGAYDNMPDSCDDCWVEAEIQAKKEQMQGRAA